MSILRKLETRNQYKITKCMVFNRGNKLCKANIVINAKHLGFTISSRSCTFANTLADLNTKAHRAVFALNSRVKLSILPPRLALKRFSTQIAPILLYGAGVWAAYSNFNFSNWGKTGIERTHTISKKNIRMRYTFP